jgi:hypothetical protein
MRNIARLAVLEKWRVIQEGDFIQIALTIDRFSTPDPLSSLRVEATQGALSVPLPHIPQTALLFSPLYAAFIPFAGAPTGSWSITATDSAGTSAPVTTLPISHPVLLPSATDVRVSDAGTTPTVSWTLPDLTGFKVDAIQVRIIDASNELSLFGADVALSTTSFRVPRGILTPGSSYIYMVLLEDRASEGGGFEAWSHAFSGILRVPEPAAPVLILAAFAAVQAARWLGRARRS